MVVEMRVSAEILEIVEKYEKRRIFLHKIIIFFLLWERHRRFVRKISFFLLFFWEEHVQFFRGNSRRISKFDVLSEARGINFSTQTSRASRTKSRRVLGLKNDSVNRWRTNGQRTRPAHAVRIYSRRFSRGKGSGLSREVDARSELFVDTCPRGAACKIARGQQPLNSKRVSRKVTSTYARTYVVRPGFLRRTCETSSPLAPLFRRHFAPPLLLLCSLAAGSLGEHA